MQNDGKDESRNKRSGENNGEEGGYIFDSPSTSVYDNVKKYEIRYSSYSFWSRFPKGRLRYLVGVLAAYRNWGPWGECGGWAFA